MKGTPASYLGRLVSKENFRAFIFAPDGSQKLVESWDEFESSMQSGLWFATADDAKASGSTDKRPKLKAKVTRMKKVSTVAEETLDDETDVISDDAAFEVKDDFLPKG